MMCVYNPGIHNIVPKLVLRLSALLKATQHTVLKAYVALKK